MSDEPAKTQVHSKVTVPIEEFSRLDQSLLFAQLSSISYSDESIAKGLSEIVGFTGLSLF